MAQNIVIVDNADPERIVVESPITVVSSGGGANVFTDLTDVPGDYSGDALKVVRVNAGETALEFATISSGGNSFETINCPTGTDPVADSSTDTLNLATGTSGTDFAILGDSSTDTVTFNLPTASATNRGALSSADWSTFNGKQAALGFTAEDVSNKSTDGTLAANSTTLYPSQSAVKTYADAKVADAINNGTTTIAPSQNAVFDALALKQDLDTQLTDLAGLSYAGNTLKVVRVNAGETAFELATIAGGSGNSFETINCPSGTDPVADSASDTLNLVIGTAGTDFAITGDSTTDTVTFDLPTASAANRGALSSADWSTFNGKQAALGFTAENVANKSTDGTLATNSTTLYPSESAVKTYADAKVADAINNGTTTIAPSQNAVFDALALKYDASNPSSYVDAAGAKSAAVSDTAYDATSWNGVTDVAGSKNAVRDQVETMLTSIAAKLPLAGGTMTGKVVPSVSVLTDAATVAVDASLGNQFTLTLGGNRTLGAPTNAVAGQLIMIAVRQDATGSRTLAYDSGAGGYRFGTDIAAITLTTTAAKTDYIGFRYNGTDSKWDVISVVKGY